jgi:hypothetical protein
MNQEQFDRMSKEAVKLSKHYTTDAEQFAFVAGALLILETLIESKEETKPPYSVYGFRCDDDKL